jgi:hypothetical protein
MNDEVREGHRLRDSKRRLGFGERPPPLNVVRDRGGEGLAPLAVDEAGRNGGVERVQGQPGIVEPLSERADRRPVVVIEM